MRLFGPIQALFPLPLDKRYYVDSTTLGETATLENAARQSNAYPFMKVVDKHTGKTWEWQGGQPNNWVLFTAKGEPGQQGKSLEFRWDGTKLGVRVEGQTQYQYVELKGTPGDNGKSLEFNWNNTELGIRQEGQSEYQYRELKGERGLSLQFAWDGTRLGVRVEGQTEYQYVDLVGPASSEESIVALIRDHEYVDDRVDPTEPDYDMYLYTDAKTIIGAINEINNKLSNIINGA